MEGSKIVEFKQAFKMVLDTGVEIHNEDFRIYCTDGGYVVDSSPTDDFIFIDDENDDFVEEYESFDEAYDIFKNGLD